MAQDPGLSQSSSDFAAVPMLGPAVLAVLLVALPAAAVLYLQRHTTEAHA